MTDDDGAWIVYLILLCIMFVPIILAMNDAANSKEANNRADEAHNKGGQ